MITLKMVWYLYTLKTHSSGRQATQQGALLKKTDLWKSRHPCGCFTLRSGGCFLWSHEKCGVLGLLTSLSHRMVCILPSSLLFYPVSWFLLYQLCIAHLLPHGNLYLMVYHMGIYTLTTHRCVRKKSLYDDWGKKWLRKEGNGLIFLPNNYTTAVASRWGQKQYRKQ